MFTRNADIWTQQGPKLVGAARSGELRKAAPWRCRLTAMPPWWEGMATSTAPTISAVPGCSANGIWTQQGPTLIGAGAYKARP